MIPIVRILDIRCHTCDLIHLVGVKRTYDVQTITKIGAAGDFQRITVAITPLRPAGSDVYLESLELAIENKVDDSTKCVGTVSG